MGQEQPQHDYHDQSDLDRTQPSPKQPPRQLDWRPPDYQSGAGEPIQEAPSVRRVSRPAPRRRPPTESAPAWVVGLGVGALLAVILMLAVAFVLSRPPAQPEPTATVFVVTPTATLVPRPTFTVPPDVTAAAESPTEEPIATAAPPPDTIAVGGYVRVVAPVGLSFRQTASPEGALIEVLNTSAVLEVIGGPQQAAGYTWWQLRKLDDGQEGWSAASSGEDIFLVPASAP
jgi:hypothetical protein